MTETSYSDSTTGITKLHTLRFKEDDTLVDGLISRNVGAAEALYDKYSDRVRRVLYQIIGDDTDLPELTNEVFFQAIKSITRLKDPTKLKPWVTQIAVFTAKKAIAQRKRFSWLVFKPSQELPNICNTIDTSERDDKLIKAIYEVLDAMGETDRIVFCLKYIEGVNVDELAYILKCSRSTAKRRLAKSEKRFKALAQSDDLLQDQLGQSAKWRRR